MRKNLSQPDEKKGEKIIHLMDSLGLSVWIYFDRKNPIRTYRVFFLNKSVMTAPLRFEYDGSSYMEKSSIPKRGDVLLLHAILTITKDVQAGGMNYTDYCTAYGFPNSKESKATWRKLVKIREKISKIVDPDQLVKDVLELSC